MKCILDINSEVYDHYYKDFFANILNGEGKHVQIIGNFPFFIEKTHCTCKLKLHSPLQDYNIFGTCTQCA